MFGEVREQIMKVHIRLPVDEGKDANEDTSETE
jgi:hypothetical protein